MTRIAIATTSRIAADAGGRVAALGGNAVDAALAAALVSTVTEPGVCALGAGAFVTVWPPGGDPVTVDGYVEMPGRGLPRERFGGGRRDVWLEYGGGVEMTVGPGSVGTPGAVAAFGEAARFGRLPWRELVEPAWEHARTGFPLPPASHRYLAYAHEAVFGWNPESHRALHDAAGRLLEPGATVRVEGLAETLRLLADEGPGAFYRGELAERIAAHVLEGGGILTAADLAAYRAVVRPALTVGVDGWSVATNPPPAVGGAALAAMLLLMDGHPRGSAWNAAGVRRLIGAQRAVLRYRRERLDMTPEVEAASARLLELAASGDARAVSGAASTVHTSAVDGEGLACAVTVSAGYGSGVMPPGTGVWLNNCLGEVELNRVGYHAWPPGTRLPSNMAPSVARGPGDAVLAIGSPGADRITTAILQVLLSHLRLGMPLPEAVAHPRLHVEVTGEGERIAYEAGMPVEGAGLPTRRFEEPDMYFGGVGAARLESGAFETAADPRRAGVGRVVGR